MCRSLRYYYYQLKFLYIWKNISVVYDQELSLMTGANDENFH